MVPALPGSLCLLLLAAACVREELPAEARAVARLALLPHAGCVLHASEVQRRLVRLFGAYQWTDDLGVLFAFLSRPEAGACVCALACRTQRSVCGMQGVPLTGAP
jgi:hypothetical protein